MTQEEILALSDKIQRGDATSEEKLQFLKELNLSAEEFSVFLRDLLAAAKKE